VRFLFYAAIGASGDILALSHYSSIAVVFRHRGVRLHPGESWCWRTIRRREGSGLFLFGMGALFLSIMYTDLVNNATCRGSSGLTLLPVGMLLMLYSQLVLMAERWIVAIRTEARPTATCAAARRQHLDHQRDAAGGAAGQGGRGDLQGDPRRPQFAVPLRSQAPRAVERGGRRA
jgi:hypothetical protein